MANEAIRSDAVRLGFIGVGGRGTSLLRGVLGRSDVAVAALSGMDEDRLKKAADMLKESGKTAPDVYCGGPTEYRKLLDRRDVDAVVVATSLQTHARVAADALRAGKHVLSEVAAAATIEECWDLVRAAEETGKTYMLAENCCYFEPNLILLNMVKAGLFGQITYAECGYVHDCRSLLFAGDGSLTWRGELQRHAGNWYPTHALGPVAQWMGLNRGDRMVSTASFASSQVGVHHFAAKRLGEDHPLTKMEFCGDSCVSLIRTARGALIELRFDVSSARPHPSTTYFSLQGKTASYTDREAVRQIWIEGRSPEYKWEPLSNYAKEYEHPLWAEHREKAMQTGHGGADFFVLSEFLKALRTGGPAPIDVYDAAAWSCLVPLSAASIEKGGQPLEVPDFTSGAWRTRQPGW